MTHINLQREQGYIAIYSLGRAWSNHITGQFNADTIDK